MRFSDEDNPHVKERLDRMWSWVSAREGQEFTHGQWARAMGRSKNHSWGMDVHTIRQRWAPARGGSLSNCTQNADGEWVMVYRRAGDPRGTMYKAFVEQDRQFTSRGVNLITNARWGATNFEKKSQRLRAEMKIKAFRFTEEIQADVEKLIDSLEDDSDE